jgi:hypothetical protein
MEFLVGIVAHEDRLEGVDSLRDQVQADYVSVDDGTLGCGGNHLAVLTQLYEMSALRSWVVVLEDDALPVSDFRDQFTKVLEVAPSPLLSLYCGTGFPAQYQALFVEAVESGVCWIMHAQLRHAVAYALHPLILKAVLTRIEKLIEQRWAPDDAIGKWAMENHTPVAYTNPQLVDHDDTKTVIDYRMHLGHVSVAGRNRPRKAYNVGSREVWDRSEVAVMGGGKVIAHPTG